MECSQKRCPRITIDGFKRCANCRAYVRRWITNNKERWQGYYKQYCQTIIGKIILRISQCKRCDRKKNLEWHPNEYITKEYIRELWDASKLCHYCKCQMQFENGNLKDGMTIERLDNYLAHIQSNVVLACHHCNCVHQRPGFMPGFRCNSETR